MDRRAPHDNAEAARINLRWTVVLRFGATLAQLVTILVTRFAMGIEVPVAALLALLAPALLSNLYAALRLRRGSAPPWLSPGLLALDVLVLTGLLSLTGGPLNPFSFLYLVPVAMAAVGSSERWTWALVLLSVLCSGVLFFHHRPLPLPGDHMRTHLRGMWVAFSIAAGFIVYFLLRVTRALAQREEDLRDLEQQAAQRERLAALATLAAGAAHELATPLSTIALAARELERALRGTPDDEARRDAELIRAEVERCRAVLTQLSADAGQSPGEALEALAPAELLEDVAGAPGALVVERVVAPAAQGLRPLLPRRAMARALRGLVKNAADAGAGRVRLLVRCEVGVLIVEVADDGPGLTPEVAARAGEPFFTTKEPGQGMGLGLFLCRAVVGGLRGALALASGPPLGGARVTLRVPILERGGA